MTIRSNEHWIDGAFVAGSAYRIEVVNPATEQVIGTVPEGTAADVDAAVRRSAEGVPRLGSDRSGANGAVIVEKIAEGLQARTEEIARSITAEMGSSDHVLHHRPGRAADHGRRGDRQGGAGFRLVGGDR